MCPGEYDKRGITGIDGDIRLNKALWMIAEQFREYKS